MVNLAEPVLHSIDHHANGDEETAAREPERDSDGASASDIAYTQTRVVQVDKALLRENRVVGGFEPGPVVDAYKIMCIQALQRLREIDGNALAIVSPGSGEGKTLTAINLALSLAHEVDQTVLLVDADLRNPGVHKYFGFTPEAGLSDYLISNTPIERVLVNPGIDRFVILPGGRPLSNSVEMLGSQKMVRLVQELKQRYPSRIVIFDLPPVLSVADTIAFAPYVDAALMIVQENGTRRDDIQRAAAMLSSVRLIGTVLNRAGEAAAPAAPVSWGRLAKIFGRRG